DLKFDHVDGTIPDTSIWVGLARNTTIDGVSGRSNILANISDSTNVSLTNADIVLANGHSAAGRVLTAWQSDGVSVSGVQADTAFDKAPFFVESWARGTSFDNINVHWRYTGTPTNAVFHLTGGSSGTFADHVSI